MIIDFFMVQIWNKYIMSHILAEQETFIDLFKIQIFTVFYFNGLGHVRDQDKIWSFRLREIMKVETRKKAKM